MVGRPSSVPAAITRDRLASRSSKLRRSQTRRLLEGMEAASLIQRHFVRVSFVDFEQSRLLGYHRDAAIRFNRRGSCRGEP